MKTFIVDIAVGSRRFALRVKAKHVQDAIGRFAGSSELAHAFISVRDIQ